MRVDIEVMEACGSCASRKACAMGSSEVREVMIYTDEASTYSIGEVVNISAKQSLGVMAVLLCYVLPLVVLVAMLAIMVSLGYSEGISAVVSLGITALYYLLLALLNKHISRKVVFSINKI